MTKIHIHRWGSPTERELTTTKAYEAERPWCTAVSSCRSYRYQLFDSQTGQPIGDPLDGDVTSSMWLVGALRWGEPAVEGLGFGATITGTLLAFYRPRS